MNFKINKTLFIINIISFLFFIFLSYLMYAQKTAPFDSYVYNFVSSFIRPGLTKLAIVISFIGDTYGIVGICLLILLIEKTRLIIALPSSITVAISAILNFIIKNIFKRPRPNVLRLVFQTGFSFPSGHSMNNMAFYTMIILCSLPYIKNKTIKYGMSIFLYLFVISIGISRIYLGVHYASDVLAGFSMGLWLSTSCYFILNSNFFIKKLIYFKKSGS